LQVCVSVVKLGVQRDRMAQTTSNVQTFADVPRRRDVYLTLLNLGCVYFLINVSYSGLETLQSTVNAQEGLGTTSIGVLYASLIVCSLLVGPSVVDRLRAKRTLYVAWSANAVFAVANAFPRWETLVPASAFVGVAMASGNIVYGLYVTGLADQLDPANGQSLSHCLSSLSPHPRRQKFPTGHSLTAGHLTVFVLLGNVVTQ